VPKKKEKKRRFNKEDFKDPNLMYGQTNSEEGRLLGRGGRDRKALLQRNREK